MKHIKGLHCMWLHRHIGLCCGNLIKLECIDVMSKTFLLPVWQIPMSPCMHLTIPIIFADGITSLFTYDYTEVEGNTQLLILEVPRFHQ